MDIAARTRVLTLCEAQDLQDALASEGLERSEDGNNKLALESFKFKDSSRDILSQFQLPSRTKSVWLSTMRHPLIMKDLSGAFDGLLFGGHNCVASDHSWYSRLSFAIIPENYRYPMVFTYGVDNTLKWLGREFDFCHEIVIGDSPNRNLKHSPLAVYNERPEGSALSKSLAFVWEKYGLPAEETEGYLEGGLSERPERVSRFDPKVCAWGWQDFCGMIRDLGRDTLGHPVAVWSRVEYGVQVSPELITQQGQELLNAALSGTDYEKFDLRLSAMIDASWGGREKLRAKLTKPKLQELGVLMNAGSAKSTVKLQVCKEGYVFVIEFDCVDSLKAFRESRVFGLVGWDIGK